MEPSRVLVTLYVVFTSLIPWPGAAGRCSEGAEHGGEEPGRLREEEGQEGGGLQEEARGEGRGEQEEDQGLPDQAEAGQEEAV